MRRLFASALGTALVVGVAATPAFAAPPVAPPQPTVVAGNSQIVVTFVAPVSDGGSPITRYDASCTSSNGGIDGDDHNVGMVAPITVLGLTNGKTYTCRVTAMNNDGTSPFSPDSVSVIPSAVPDPPAPPNVTPGAAQIGVAFVAPFDGGSPITGYTATCSSSNGGALGTTPGASSPISVTGLSNGKSYTCTVLATNANGSGPPSPASVPAIPISIPATPVAPTVAAGNTQIQVIFTPPFDNGSPITSYAAECLSSDGGDPGAQFGAGSPLTVSGLTNGKTYTCTLTATNAVGTTPLSPPSVPVVTAQVPDPPAKPTVAPGNARITVTFGPANGNGHPITSFTARCASTNGGITRSQVGAASPITVSLLTNAKTYTCTVAARNLLGLGPPSLPSVPVIPATIPAAPTMKSAVSGNAALKVSFTPNANNGRPITSFTVSCTSSNGGQSGAQSGPTSPITVPSLANGKRYTCQARARNSVGLGPLSLASKPIVVGQPAAPVITAAVPTIAPAAVGGIRVSYTPGPANASPITSFRVRCTPLTPGTTRVAVGTGTAMTVIGLLTGRGYTCGVVATNAIGTSVESNMMSAKVGTPGPPKVLSTLPMARGLAMPFTAPPNNGKPITGYRARCTSPNGGVPASPLRLTSPIVVTNLTAGKTYNCTVTAINARGEGPATKAGPVIARPPFAPNLASCTGSSGTMRITPGLLVGEVAAHNVALAATFPTCTGPYVRAATLTASLNSNIAFSCANPIGKLNIGLATLTWTSPAGLGKSTASIQLAIASTTGHTTTAIFMGAVTSVANLFTDAFVSGTLTLNKGVAPTSSGGDCAPGVRLENFGVTGITMTLS